MSDIKPEWVDALVRLFGPGVGDRETYAAAIAEVAPLIREAVANEIASEIDQTLIPDLSDYGTTGAADWMRSKAADIAFRIGEGNE